MKSNLYAFVDSFVCLIICSVVSLCTGGLCILFPLLSASLSLFVIIESSADEKRENFPQPLLTIFPTLLRYLASLCCQRRHRRLCRRILSTIFSSVEANDNGINRAEEMKIKSWAT